jgi:hypothetical protein
MKKIILSVFIASMFLAGLQSCNIDPTSITQIIYNRVSAKERLDSANAQAQRKYGSGAKLVLILGQNVIFEGDDKGKTDISIVTGLSDPNNLGAWIYVYKKPGTDTLAVYTPNPTPGAKDCWELTSVFNINTLIGLIPDTSAKNIIQGAITLVNNTNFNITTPISGIVDSDVSLGWANSTNPVIKFNSSFTPSSSTLNGDYFFSNNTTGAVKTVNMFLIPGLGTLNLPNFVTSLTGFPADVWVVNYKKSFTAATESLTIGTVVGSSQILGIPFLSLTSKCINLSKFINQ